MTGTDFAERAAILEYDNGMSRADAEAQAAREIYANWLDSRIWRPGIRGELAEVELTKSDPRLTSILSVLQLDSPRSPAYGFQHILSEGDGYYRPAIAPEFGTAAVVVAATEDGELVDLAAATLDRPQLTLTRLGAAYVVGADYIEFARSAGRPLYIFPTLLQWLKGGAIGAVVVDWQHIGRELDGVEEIICSASIAARLHAGTRKCFPVPAIATPSVSESRRAA